MKLDLTFVGISREQAQALIEFSKSLTFPAVPTAEILIPAENLNNFTANPIENGVTAPAAEPVNSLGTDQHTEAAKPSKGKEKDVKGFQEIDGLQCDKNGVPFNSNFHLPKLTAKNEWASRRNIDKAAKAEYENTYKNATPAPATTVPAAAAVPPIPGQQPAVPAATLPVPGQTLPAPAVPALPIQEECIDIDKFVKLYTDLHQRGVLNGENVARICKQTQVTEISEFMQKTPEADQKRTTAYYLFEGLEAAA